jgi:hypothetical protein
VTATALFALALVSLWLLYRAAQAEERRQRTRRAPP